MYENSLANSGKSTEYQGVEPITVDNEKKEISVKTATDSSLGVVKGDKTTTRINADGSITALGGGAQQQADWAENDDTKPSYIKNKPVIIDPVQADWNEIDLSKLAYIKNKPNIVDNLDSTSAMDALSANMGRMLYELASKALSFPHNGYVFPEPPDRVNTVFTFGGTGKIELKKIWLFDNWRCIRVADTESTTDLNLILPGEDKRKGKVVGFADDDGKRIEMKDIPTPYTLPVSGPDVLGGVKIKDKSISGLEISEDGDLTVAQPEAFKLKVGRLPASGSWSSLCHAFEKFITIASRTNIVAYSSGDTWQSAELPQESNYVSSCYGNGKIVVITSVSYQSDQLVFLYSSDAITWKVADTSELSRGRWRASCFGNGVFVVLTYLDGKAAYSTDGVKWKPVDLPNRGQYMSSCFGNGIFVAVASGTDKGIYSTNGIDWIEFDLPASRSWKSVCFGNGIFVAIPESSNKGVYSFDGIHWMEFDLPETKRWVGVCYGDGKFVAIADYSTIAVYSFDGIHWMKFDLPDVFSFTAICCGDGKFVATSYDSDKVLIGEYIGGEKIEIVDDLTDTSSVKALSANMGKTLNETKQNILTAGAGIGLGTNELSQPASHIEARIGAGLEFVSDDITLKKATTTSLGGVIPDGETITVNDMGKITAVISPVQPIKLEVLTLPTSIAACVNIGGKYIGVGSSTTGITSYNGYDFAPTVLPDLSFYNTIAYGNGVLVASTSQSDKLVWSENDGFTWTPISKPAGMSINTGRLCFSNGAFKCCCLSPDLIMRSSNGKNWETIPNEHKIQDFYPLIGRDLASGTEGVFFVTNDTEYEDITRVFEDENWKTYQGFQTKEALIVFGASLEALKSDRLYTSKDNGTTWAKIQLPIAQFWTNCCYLNGKYFLFGVVEEMISDKALVSSDALHWEVLDLPISGSWQAMAAGWKRGLIFDLSSNQAVSIMVN